MTANVHCIITHNTIRHILIFHNILIQSYCKHSSCQKSNNQCLLLHPILLNQRVIGYRQIYRIAMWVPKITDLLMSRITQVYQDVYGLIYRHEPRLLMLFGSSINNNNSSRSMKHSPSPHRTLESTFTCLAGILLNHKCLVDFISTHLHLHV